MTRQAEGAVLLMPLVPPWAAYVLDRDQGDWLRQKAHSLAATQPEVARQLLVAAEQLREAARHVVAAELVRGSGAQAGGGSAEVPMSADGSGSECLLGSGLTTREVAVQLRVSERQVVNLIGKRLAATSVRGRWVIDEVSVAMELKRRRQASEQRDQ